MENMLGDLTEWLAVPLEGLDDLDFTLVDEETEDFLRNLELSLDDLDFNI